MSIEFTDSVYWITECSEIGDDKHMHTAVYVLRTDNGDILVDTGSHIHQDSLKNKVEQITGKSGADAIIISHADLPHSGNVRYFQEQWDDPTIISSAATPSVVGLPERTQATIGTETEVLGRKFTFVDPPLGDIAFSSWPFDHESKILFSVDGFGSYHYPNNCDNLIKTTEDVPSIEQIRQYHSDTFRWLKYVDISKFNTILSNTIDRNNITYIAPTHGSPISPGSTDKYLSRLNKAVAEIASQ